MKSIKEQVTTAEWNTRVELAAAYRAFYYLGFEFTTFGHLSARVPGEPDCLLLNPFGLTFDEITASSLIKVRKDGTILTDNGYQLNKAGWNIHSGLIFGNDSINSAMHLHTVDGVAVSAMKEGVLPLCQDDMLIHSNIAYHDYEGVVVDAAEGPRMLSDIGDKKILMLRNHGTLSVGETISEAFFYMFFLEKSCKIQTRALGSPQGVVNVNEAIVDHVPEQKKEVMAGLPHEGNDTDPYHTLYEGWLRRMKREYPEFDN
ncbi:class II aldolase/adducin family protein [Flammeovirga kamogawensis]|uniref:Class II aldolase/adducin family protein n=1 Tax=Flammeovirga kamogawensis TaxID=373891 RepID=A0ABX8GPT9_9BACT|nr:class II aldolase/adducin family protein [Flammeovirga kamogawensis]MBB6463464.1 ribulose-5-phosphate 4-epimerase/fuculose-1-phosphate aldolase [Flammeovirga kamogawensis]QWG05610.1 class II aldolase/adducin family protein [Flammeovirga kamogawensis]TRX67442.1 class II aldolase [Flammeovirga kamogawensis]